MVILRNSKINNNILTTHYYPELCKDGEYGIIKYDIKKAEVIEYQYAVIDEQSFFKPYFNKALVAIERMLEEKNIPEKYVLMWY